MAGNSSNHGKDSNGKWIPMGATTDSNNNPAVAMVAKGGIAFTPSSYDADLTMDATGEALALATGVLKVRVVNKGVTTEDLRVAFGTSEADALSNLTIAAGAATTGVYLYANADSAGDHKITLGVPANATHIAAAPATAGDTQSVSMSQGV